MKRLHFIFFCFVFSNYSVALDTLAPNQTLRDGVETLVSAGSSFKLGFFSPKNSDNRYIGIWFNNVPEQTVVWVANKNNPLTNTSGILTITSSGNITIMDSQSGIAVWSSNSSGTNPVLQLLNTGNLVVKDGGSDNNSGSYIWQSFDHPCDTLLPGMKMGSNLETGLDWYLTSWTSKQDPSAGDLTYKLDHRGLPAVFLRRGSQVQFRSGPWDGFRFGGGPELQQNSVFIPRFVLNTTHVYYSYDNNDNSTISRFVLDPSGWLQYLTWSQKDGDWVAITTLNANDCDEYEKCGPYGICNFADQWFCHCPDGFTPKSPQNWNQRQTSDGCVARTPLNCSAGEGFRKVSRLKLPDNSYLNMTIKSEECENACLSSCSCVAYAKTEVSSCVLWFGNLLDIRVYSEGGQDLYIRVAASELDSNNNNKRTAAIISTVVVSGVLVAAIVGWYFCRRKTTARRRAETVENPIQGSNYGIEEEDLDLPLFDLATIRAATNDFSFTNKIGQGGFGPVYRGQLSTGQEIAVKRLSEDSGQGLKEFKNEVIFIAKLQHRNLVRLLGCCIDGEERMLIYEYMPNKSLDLFVFNQTRGAPLDWGTRFDIIVGIARGLLYLHRDSRLRIIHRDLKASNVLLDSEMNPKISDFGLARLFGGDQTEANTKRVMGTYGYMSPEYAIDGVFSVKSDVFSFGVLLLEIVSGKRNRGFYHPDHDLNLLGHAWNLWNEGRGMELVDVLMEGPLHDAEVLLCVQVGLLCVQQRPEDRPTMSWVVLMLDSENPILPQPKQPGFYTERFPVDTDSSSTGKRPATSNELTVTMLHGR